MGQNLAGMTATGTYSDSSTADITNTVAWSVSDSSIASINAANGIVTIAAAGKIWGGDIGVTATLAPGTPGTASLLVIASDSGSVAPLMPQQNNHWTALGLSPWGSWWGVQEASGSDTLIGSGSAPYNLGRADGTGGEGIGARQGGTLTNWTRACITLSGSTGQSLTASAGFGPNPGSTSTAFLGYGQLGQNGAVVGSWFMGHIAGTAAQRSGIQTVASTSRTALSFLSNLGSKRLVGPVGNQHSDRVHPFLYIYNKTSAEAWCFSDIVLAMSSSHAALSDNTKGFGPISTSAASSASWVWLATATGSIVERLCDPSASADFLTRLGWSVPWKTCPTESGSIKLPFLKMHWDEVGLQTWTATWNMQDEGTGIAQNSFDRWEGFVSDGWQLTAGASPVGGTFVPGWNRGCVQFSQIAATRLIRACINQVQWDPTGSQAYVAYVSASLGTAGVRGLFGCTIGNASAAGLTLFTVFPSSTATPAVYCAGATATASNAINDNRVHPILMVYDKTNTRVKLYTDLEKVTGSFNALSLVANTTGNLTFGGTNSSPFTTPPPMQIFWASFCTGALAESLSDDGKASDFLKRLGWTIPW